MFKIGSHDSISAERPLTWWGRLLRFGARCQRETIETQYEKYDIRLFDLRLRYDKKNQKWRFSHGSIMFDRDVWEVFNYIDKKGGCLVRLLLEYNREPKDIDKIQAEFLEICDYLRERYKNTTFFEYRRKYDWKKIYTYDGEPNVSMYQAVSSTTGTIIDDWCPWIYAYRHNKDIKKQGTHYDWLLMDFIGMW